MPNIKSAEKRISVTARRKQENRVIKSTLATLIKKFRANIASGNVKDAEIALPELEAYAKSAASKGVIPGKTASRKVARAKLLLHKAKSGKVTAVKIEKKAAPKVAAKPAVKAEAKPTADKVAVKAEVKKAVVKTEVKSAAVKTEAKPAVKPAVKAEAKTASKPAVKKAASKTEK